MPKVADEDRQRRRRGTGGIYQMKTGRWRGEIDLGWSGGRRLRRIVYGLTRAEVESKLALLLPAPRALQTSLGRVADAGDMNDGLTSWERRKARMFAADGKGTHTVEQWQAKLQAVGCCIYCGVEAPLGQDHAVPVVRGGDNSIANVVPACPTCNSEKQNMTAREFVLWRAVQMQVP